MTKDIEREHTKYLAELLKREVIKKVDFEDIVFKSEINAFHSNYLSARFMDNINFGWSSWQAAKAHEAEKLKGKVVVPSNSVTLNCEQLLTVLQYGAPDLQVERTEYSEEQMETEMSIVWLKDGHSGEGYYAYYTELPEEGSINLNLMLEAARGGN